MDKLILPFLPGQTKPSRKKGVCCYDCTYLFKLLNEKNIITLFQDIKTAGVAIKFNNVLNV